MKAVLSVEQVRACDANAIENIGIPEVVLMENAAKATLDFVSDRFSNNEKVLILCGAGNNGGDGLALARLMIGKYDVNVLFIGKTEKMSNSARMNYQALSKLGFIVEHFDEAKQYNYDKYDVIIDALIGVGFSGDLRESTKSILRDVNASLAVKYAIDVPTGLNSDTGEYDEDCLRADYTLSMFASKTGVFLAPKEVVGEILIGNLGLPEDYPHSFADTFTLEDSDIDSFLPKRQDNTSKFDYGKVGIVAGSAMYSGAATLVANACIKSGAGLVYLFSIDRQAGLLPEVIFEKVCSNNGYISPYNYDMLIERLSACDAILLGSGIGKNSETHKLIKRLVDTLPANIPIVIDAEAISCVKDLELRENIILTPHIGEFANLIGASRADVVPHKDCKEAAKKHKCNILLKGRPTIISNGEKSYFNVCGNPGMATAGSGDVLAGIITSLLAQGVSTLEAGALGAYLHSKLGDSYAERHNQISLSASDLISEMKFLKY